MAFTSILMRCLAQNAVKYAANLLTFGVGGDFLSDVWEAWRNEQQDGQRRGELERLALR